MNTRRIGRGLVVLAMATAATVTVPNAVADAPGSHSNKAVAGTWEYTITQESPPTPLPTRGVLTLAADGGLVNVDERAVAGPAKATAGLGRWQAAKRGSFRLKFVEYLAGPQGSVLTLTLRGTGQLDGSSDAFTAEGAYEVTDTAGNVVFAGANAIRGVRMSAP